MFLKKEGLPEEGELLLCTVSDIQYHAVFVKLDEYGNQTGMIHISEISPGRIRNIRDFVTVGKKIVCKVLRINEEKRHIDLSLRRVNEGQKKEKINEIKQEQKAEKIIEFVASELKIKPTEFYAKIWQAVLSKDYPYLYSAFNEVVINDLKLESLGIDKNLAVPLEEIVRQRIKPPSVTIGGIMKIQTFKSDGIAFIKNLITPTLTSSDITIKYNGAGKYDLLVTKENYKEAEKVLKEVTDQYTKSCNSSDTTFEFIRREIKIK